MSEKVKTYFDRISTEFDNIYDSQGSVIDRLINKVFRKSMYQRAELTLDMCGGVSNKRVLDVGCGSGRTSIALAKAGARVTGIDYSENMIKLANEYLGAEEKDLSVRFICADFIDGFHCEELFDIVVGLGLFDYLKDPIPCLTKMKQLTKEGMIISYPARCALQTPLRKVWLWIRGCPVYFYTEGKLEEMYRQVGIEYYVVFRLPLGTPVPDGYLVVSEVDR